MKTLKQSQNKWFLTAALLGALVLNSGLWQVKQNLMSSSDFSSNLDPVATIADLRSKKTIADQALETAKRDLAKAKADWEAAKISTKKDTEELATKKIMDEKQAAFTKAETDAKTAATNLSTYEEGLRKLSTAAGVIVPGVPCDSAECKENQALREQLKVALAKIPQEPKEKEKTTEEKDRERTTEELDRVVRNCKDEREDRQLKCYTTELLEILDRNKGDKKLVKKMVVKFYEDKIEESLRQSVTSRNGSEMSAALAIVAKFEKSLPSDYNFLRDEVTDTARQSAKQLAVTSQDYLRAAQDVRKEDPALATSYLQSHRYYKDLFTATTSNLDRALLGGLSIARKDGLITDSYMRNLYETRWQREMIPVVRGLNSANARTFRIDDEEGFSFDHIYQRGLHAGLSIASNVASGSRRQGRNASLRLDGNRGVQVGEKLGDTRNLDTIFGTLGSDSGRKGSGRRARSN